MPQTKVDRKFFQGRVDRRLPNLESKIDKKLAVVEFYEFQTNIARGVE